MDERKHQKANDSTEDILSCQNVSFKFQSDTVTGYVDLYPKIILFLGKTFPKVRKRYFRVSISKSETVYF